MDNDLILVVGLVIGILALPALLGAYSEDRPPRTGAILILISGVLVAVALSRSSIGYRMEDIPGVFTSVIRRYLG